MLVVSVDRGLTDKSIIDFHKVIDEIVKLRTSVNSFVYKDSDLEIGFHEFIPKTRL